jgi:hypothetical protein
MNRTGSRPEFVIKATGHLSHRSIKPLKTTQSPSLPGVGGLGETSKNKQALEMAIGSLQSKCVRAAEQLEEQKEKECFYDSEILRLNRLIEETRMRKVRKKDGNADGKQFTLSTKEGFLGKTLEDSAVVPSHMKTKISKVNSSINETKAKNKQLREVLNDLRGKREQYSTNCLRSSRKPSTPKSSS